MRSFMKFSSPKVPNREPRTENKPGRTITSHPAAALGLRRWFGQEPLPAAVVMAGAIGSILPDVDVAGFGLGIPYGSLFGHRGFTHSIVFALLVAAIGALLLR